MNRGVLSTIAVFGVSKQYYLSIQCIIVPSDRAQLRLSFKKCIYLFVNVKIKNYNFMIKLKLGVQCVVLFGGRHCPKCLGFKMLDFIEVEENVQEKCYTAK